MAITNGYTTTTLLKGRLGVTDSSDDTIMEAVITAVSRLIDMHTRRRFFTTSSDETRYFTPQTAEEAFIDDLISITNLATDDNNDLTHSVTWATTDYVLHPRNANLDTKPYTSIIVTGSGRYTFYPNIDDHIKLVGKYGYCSSTPSMISEACLIQSERIFKRKDSPFGVVGVTEFGQAQIVSSFDPDVKMLLEPFRRLV